MSRVLTLLAFLVLPAAAQEFAAPPFTFVDGPTSLYIPSQVMANFQNLINGGNAAGARINTAILGVSSFPTGAIVWFNLGSCPSGWGTVASTDNRFIRAYDPDGTVDPNSAIGQTQVDTMQAHTHNVDNAAVIGYGVVGLADGSQANATFLAGGAFTTNPITGAVQGTTTASETRPPNVTLRLCKKS